MDITQAKPFLFSQNPFKSHNQSQAIPSQATSQNKEHYNTITQ